MPDMMAEQLICLTDVPDHLPARRGKKLALATVYLWARESRAGKDPLETVRVGGILYTSHEALARFAVQSRPSRVAVATDGDAADKIARAKLAALGLL